MSEQEKRRVVVADFSVLKFSPTVKQLKEEGVHVHPVTDLDRLHEVVEEHQVDVCVVNLMLGGMGPFDLISGIRNRSKFRELRIIVVSKQVQKQNIQNSMKAGANDFVPEPFDGEELFQRILYHLIPKREIEPRGYEGKRAAKTKNPAQPFVDLLLEAAEELSRLERGKEHPTFIKILQRLATLTKSNRTSLIIVDQATHTGIVLATSDDPSFCDFPVALTKYPEILHVVNTGHVVVIDDVSQNVLTHKLSETVKSIMIGSVMVFPVRHLNEIVGVLTIRRPEVTELPPVEVMRVLQALANTMAAHSKNQVILKRVYREYGDKPA